MSLLLAGPAVAAPVAWRTAQTPEQVQAELDRAVEDAAAQFSWAIRAFARPRLAEAATACSGYRFERSESLTWSCDDYPFITRAPGDRSPWTSPKGKTYVIDVTHQGDTWTVDFQGDGEGKKITYRFAGDALTVIQEVYSAQLSEPMRWTLSYRKAQ